MVLTCLCFCIPRDDSDDLKGTEYRETYVKLKHTQKKQRLVLLLHMLNYNLNESF